jgi:HTH-type transcriptional regulator/antitoxin HigA
MIRELQTEYQPTSVSPPGNSLLDTLDALGMSQAELAGRSGLAQKTVNLIINGKAPITEGTALALERVLGTPGRFWLARESKYREHLARREEDVLNQRHADWARRFPYKQMADLGWVEPVSNAGGKAWHLLRFFGVSNQDCWRKMWATPQAVFRQSARAGKKPEIVSAWLRRGELKAQENNVAAFDERAFQEVIHLLRALTNEPDPNVFMREISERCAGAGVRFLLVRELPSLGVYGATRWLAGAPVIQQSLLLKTHDHFWFTFFHEAKHVLQKVKKRIFIEGDKLAQQDVKREEEANRFAAELLLPAALYKPFVEQGDFSARAIRALAKSVDIHPGIVVGRLQREQHIGYGGPAGRLTIRFKWSA